MRRLAALLLYAVAPGCALPPAANDAAAPAPEKAAAPAPAFSAIGRDIHAMVFDPAMAAEAIRDAAKDRCGAAAFCQVHGWTARREAARAMPMTDPEVAAMGFTYTVNRSSGFESAMWDCRRWPRPAAECLPR
ncbi:MAG: hypothetical protein AB7O91_03950 [Sphingomonas sp.]